MLTFPEDTANSNKSKDQDLSAIVKDGREFHSVKDSTYWLPKDFEEKKRLNLQHRAAKALFGGHIVPQIADNLKIALDSKGTIIDLCCGTGMFISEIALEYPNSICIGVDMVDIFEFNENINNVSFQEGNLLSGLSFEDNSVDLITMNYCTLNFKRNQWVPVLKEIKRVLKPGGYFLSKEPEHLKKGDDFAMWAQDCYLEKIKSNGQVPYLKNELRKFMTEVGFEQVESIDKSLYFDQPRQMDQDYRLNLCYLFKSLLPNLADDLNLTPEKYDDFTDQFYEHLGAPGTEYVLGLNFGRKPL